MAEVSEDRFFQWLLSLPGVEDLGGGDMSYDMGKLGMTVRTKDGFVCVEIAEARVSALFPPWFDIGEEDIKQLLIAGLTARFEREVVNAN